MQTIFLQMSGFDLVVNKFAAEQKNEKKLHAAHRALRKHFSTNTCNYILLFRIFPLRYSLAISIVLLYPSNILSSKLQQAANLCGCVCDIEENSVSFYMPTCCNHILENSKQ